MTKQLKMSNAELVSALSLSQDTLTALRTGEGTEYTSAANEVLSAIVNKIVYQTVDRMEFTSPFDRFEGFKINYGSTLENIFVDVPEGYDFNKDGTDPFTKKAVDVKSLYVSINITKQYLRTIDRDLIRRAVLNEGGLADLINKILATTGTAISIDRYFATIGMLQNQNMYGGKAIEEIAVADQTAEALTAKIIDISSRMALPSKSYNAMGVMQVTPKDRQLLVIRRDLLNQINLDYLTGVYNLSKIDLMNNIIAIDSFKITPAGSATSTDTELAFVILDTKGFDNHTALMDTESIYNPKGRYFNYYDNYWGIIAYKQFFNAKAYKFAAK